MATLPAWKQIYNTLRRAAVPKGYTTLFPLGGKQTQTFEFRKGGKPTAIVAFRDVAKKGDYARPNRLWVEGLDLVLERYVELHGSRVRLPPSFALSSTTFEAVSSSSLSASSSVVSEAPSEASFGR
jgi:hypothetical protein